MMPDQELTSDQIEARQLTIEEIGNVLTLDEIVFLIKQATGKDPYNLWAGLDDPRAVVLSKTLKVLANDGWDRWILTYVLIAKVSDDLRKSIVEAWPNTLIRLPQAEEQVDKAVIYLSTVLKVALSTDLKFEVGDDKRQAFKELLGRIAALCAYKNLHECLHQLDLKLVSKEPGGAGPDFNSIALRCDDVVQNAPSSALLLGAQSDQEATELRWIEGLKISATSLKSAVAASDTASCVSTIEKIQPFVRFHLKRLNGKVFEAATVLSFDALMRDLPKDVMRDKAFEKLVFYIRDFKPTVMARALKHNLWQETENDFSLLESFFNVSGDEVVEVSKPWFAVKKRMLWLASLDPDDPWAGQAREFSDEISDAILNKKRLDDETKAHFERYRNLFRIRFLAVDNTMKLDCGSLRKIDGPLTDILTELAS
jgi:hypothetical protein